MKAIVVTKFGDEKVLAFKDVEIPKPKEKQVLVKVFANGLNPIDVYVKSGMIPYTPQPPFVLGFDIAGVVEQVGKESKWKKGERVYGSIMHGGCAQYAIADDDKLFHLPEKLSFEQGSSIPIPYLTAYLGCIQTDLKSNDSILIHGASGGVGIAAIQIAKYKGVKEIWGTAGSEEGLELLRKEGCTKVFNHRKEGFVQEIIKAGGTDVILEMKSDANFQSDVEIAKTFGRIAIIGGQESKFDARSLYRKRLTVVGVVGWIVMDNEREEMEKGMREGLKSGIFSPVIQKTYPLNQTAQAHVDLITSTSSRGKLVVLPWN
eukprot:TRINITY_DN3182_c0_g1_i1.p1 TRINITY_DN3182_c0_g1~~TRINITY_DN3182_c0_g1_i1.p1  ORF type:complete len:318 (-),score=95.61 TRINITY_DN3182_c0_g1_i1:72-1025(-)